MFRRDFFKGLGMLTLGAVAAPTVVINTLTPKPSYRTVWHRALMEHKMEVERAFLYGVHVKNVRTAIGTLSCIRHPMFVGGM